MIILVGASATGKSVVVKEMMEKFNFSKVVTYTTRPMRVGEVNHIDYHFVSKEEFLNKIEKKYFIEYANYNDNLYGTAYEDISSNKVLIVEPNGANIYYEKLQNRVMIVFLNASQIAREKRMVERGDSTEVINRRLENDENHFSLKNINHVDLIIETDNKSIEEIASIIVNEYEKMFK